MDQYKFNVQISVVIPVFNVEKYLSICLDSVIRQTYRKLQIICVDDGSLDRSLQILEMYQKKDERILIIQSEHKGAAAARNIGMQYACGKYIIFLDSDDMIEPNMIEQLYLSISKYNAEIAVCEYDTSMKIGENCFTEEIKRKYMGIYSQKVFRLQDLNLDGFTMWGMPPWTKLYETGFLQKNKLEFQQIKSSNDKYFSVMSLIYAKKIIHTSQYRALIHYRTNIGGQISSGRKITDAYLAWKRVYKEMQENCPDHKIYRQYYQAVLSDLIYELTRKSESDEEKKIFYDFLSKNGLKELGFENLTEECDLGIYNEIFNCFQKDSYESRWYRNKQKICIQLEKKGLSEIKELCKKNKVVLCGIGERSFAVLRSFEKEKINVYGIFDNDPAKMGMNVSGYCVQPYSELKEDTDIILITSKLACDEICSSIAKNMKVSVRILPVFMWLESELKLQDCMIELNAK